MDRSALQATQQPLKDAYREDPDRALITLSASATLGEGISCSVATASSLVEAGLHPATGGTGMQACSGDMLLQALAACAGVTMNAVATSLEIPLDDAVVNVTGDLDFSGTLGVNKEAPVGFTAIRVSFDLNTSASEEQIDTLLRLTERYCVVFQTLEHSPELAVAVSRS